MKTKFYLILILISFLAACQKENEPIKLCDSSLQLIPITIIEELPKIDVGNLELDEFRVIESEDELLNVFSSSQIENIPQIKTINFDDNTLLLYRLFLPKEYESVHKVWYKPKLCDIEEEDREEYAYNVIYTGKIEELESFISGVVIGKILPDVEVRFSLVRQY